MSKKTEYAKWKSVMAKLEHRMKQEEENRKKIKYDKKEGK